MVTTYQQTGWQRQGEAKTEAYHALNFNEAEDVKNFMLEVLESKERWRHPYERQWFTNISYLIGNQWMKYDDRSRTIRSMPRLEGKPKIVINKVIGVVNNLKAKFLKADPIVNVEPATTDEEDVLIASLLTKTLRYYERHLSMGDIRDQFLDWMFATGNGFYKASWNPNAGPEMEFDYTDI